MENDIPQNTLLGNKKGHYYLKAFLIPAIIAIVLFLPFIIMDKGYFLYYGDFNVQQIPFYQMIHDSIQNGNFGWSNTTDLGADIVGSYSFYMIAKSVLLADNAFPKSSCTASYGTTVCSEICLLFTFCFCIFEKICQK